MTGQMKGLAEHKEAVEEQNGINELRKAWAQGDDRKVEALEIAVKRIEREKKQKDTSISEMVKEWVLTTDGEWFFCRDVYEALQIPSGRPRQAAYQAIHRLMENDTIDKDPNIAGKYRRRVCELVEMNLEREDIDSVPIDLPFGLSEMVNIYPKSIILIAGYSDSGKTALCIDIVKRNMYNFDVRYFNCEMGETEMIKRLRAHEDVGPAGWDFHAYERSDNFADVIFPDAVNIVDYIPMGDGFYMIGQKLREIHSRLRTGIAVVGLQKDYGNELGRGGAFSLELPRLYLSVNPGVVKVVKAKNWADPCNNPNRKVLDFKLVGGWKIVPQGTWRTDSAREAEMSTHGSRYGGR